MRATTSFVVVLGSLESWLVRFTHFAVMHASIIILDQYSFIYYWELMNIYVLLGALCGYGQITSLVLISYDRCNVIVKGLINGAPLTFKKAVSWITLSWIWALGWSLCPMLGCGAYAIDGMLGT